MTPWWVEDADREEYREYQLLARTCAFFGLCIGILLGVGFTLLAASQHWLVFH